MSKDAQNIDSSDDESSFEDIILRLKTGWHSVLGGVSLGLVGALIFVLLVPPQYQASVVIVPARMPVGAVESLTQTAERAKQPAFYSNELVKMCDANSSAELVAKINVNQVRNTNLLSATYRAKSSTLAESCLSGIVAHIIVKQSESLAPLVQEFQDQLKTTKQQIAEIERFLSVAEVRSTSVSDAFSVMLKREDLFRLLRVYSEQRIQASPPILSPMMLLAPVHASETPVSPNLMLVIFIGLSLGLSLGLIVLFVNGKWRKNS